MEYIGIKNGHIERYFCSVLNPQPQKGEELVIVNDFDGFVGDPVTFYNPDWTRKSELQLVKEGLKPIPEGVKLNEAGDGFVPLSEVEKIEAGLKPMPEGFKVVNHELVEMTDEEKLAEGLITRKDLLLRELAECHAWFHEEGGSDELACKCMCEGLIFRETYPELYAQGVEMRARINNLESELALL